MQLTQTTIDILKNFSSINTNLVIRAGSKIETMSASKDIMVSYDCEESFAQQMSIFNMNEFLGVLNAFNKPELDLDVKYVTIKQGKQKVKYNYADEAFLITPPKKGLNFPAADISFELGDVTLSKLQKMASILSAEDMSVIGDGKTISIKIFDKKNPSTNTFDFDVETDTSEIFQVNFKIDKLKLYPGTYTLDISSKRISRFTHSTLPLIYFIAVESDSTFT